MLIYYISDHAINYVKIICIYYIGDPLIDYATSHSNNDIILGISPDISYDMNYANTGSSTANDDKINY